MVKKKNKQTVDDRDHYVGDSGSDGDVDIDGAPGRDVMAMARMMMMMKMTC